MARDAGPEPPAGTPARTAQPSPEEVRAQLARIVASPDPDVPERSRGFRTRIAELVHRVRVSRPMRTSSPILVVRSA